MPGEPRQLAHVLGNVTGAVPSRHHTPMSEMPSLVVPSEIPWAQLTSQALEELLFWLSIELGGRDVQWRTGSGGPSADGGRDVEATFHVTERDGTLTPRRWWIQAKGRSGTVEAMAVKEAVITASGFADVETVVIATNSAFSNPTRDWVAEFNRGHDRPTAVLWDRNDLESMVVAHPSVLLRVAPEALAPQGMVAAIVARFRTTARVPSEGETRHVWEHLDSVELAPMATMALAAGEREHGSLAQRPWIMRLEDEDVLTICSVGLANLPALIYRAVVLGVGERPLYRLGEHLVSVALARLGQQAVGALLSAPWALVDQGHEIDDETVAMLREQIYEPVYSGARRHLGCACAEDCRRMLPSCEDDVVGSKAFDYLTRVPQAPPDPRMIDIEVYREPCGVGLSLGEDERCPWFRDVPLWDVVGEVQHALRVRLDSPVDDNF
jgi:hypothetical protein